MWLGRAAVSVFGAALPLASSRAQGRFSRFAGQTVGFSIPEHAHYDAMLKLLPDFTAQTGIKVEVAREHILRMKFQQLSEMSKPHGHLDLVCYVVMWKGEYVAKKLLRELAPLMADPQLADPAFDVADIVPGYLQNLGLVGGPKGYLAGPGARLYGLPYGAETSVLAYRRDVFAQAGLQPPRTYAELRTLLHVLKDKLGMAALASRGQAGHQCVHAWLLHLNPLGGRVFDDKWHPAFAKPEGVAALALLKEIADTGHPEMAQMGQAEMMRAFLQGQTAMYLDSTIIFGPVRDAAQSKVDGKVSYVLHPRGARYSSQSGGLGLAVARNAKNPEAAFLLMQWLTSKAQDKAVCRLGGGPTRWSTLGDAELVRRYPEYITLKEQLRYADPDWRPIIPPWDDINTGPLGAAVHQGLSGQKAPAQALQAVVPRVSEIMQRAGYPG